MIIGLLDISDACGGNAGGLARLTIIPIENITAIPLPGSDEVIHSPVQVEVDTAFIKIPVAAGRFTEDEENSEAGEFYRQKISISLAKDRPNARKELAKYKGMRFVALYQDENANRKIVGSLESPLTLRTNTDTGESGGKNGYEISLEGESLTKAFFYDAIPESILNTLQTSDGVDIQISDGSDILIAS